MASERNGDQLRRACKKRVSLATSLSVERRRGLTNLWQYLVSDSIESTWTCRRQISVKVDDFTHSSTRRLDADIQLGHSKYTH
jgi:hypothetical protein